MKEYSIVPEFSHSRTYPFAASIYQLTAIGLVVGHCITSVGYVVAVILQLSAFYFLFLFLCNRNYRLHITPVSVTVWNVFGKPKQYPYHQIRWKIKRVPWYNIYYVVVYSASRMPIALLKAPWKNASKILKFPHRGPLTVIERKYIAFLKSCGIVY